MLQNFVQKVKNTKWTSVLSCFIKYPKSCTQISRHIATQQIPLLQTMLDCGTTESVADTGGEQAIPLACTNHS